MTHILFHPFSLIFMVGVCPQLLVWCSNGDYPFPLTLLHLLIGILLQGALIPSSPFIYLAIYINMGPWIYILFFGLCISHGSGERQNQQDVYIHVGRFVLRNEVTIAEVQVQNLQGWPTGWRPREQLGSRPKCWQTSFLLREVSAHSIQAFN